MNGNRLLVVLLTSPLLLSGVADADGPSRCPVAVLDADFSGASRGPRLSTRLAFALRERIAASPLYRLADEDSAALSVMLTSVSFTAEGNTAPLGAAVSVNYVATLRAPLGGTQYLPVLNLIGTSLNVHPIRGFDADDVAASILADLDKNARSKPFDNPDHFKRLCDGQPLPNLWPPSQEEGRVR